jgi:hypothetical protein
MDKSVETTSVETGEVKKVRCKETKTRTILKEEQVIDILTRYYEGISNQKELSAEYKVTQGAISHIVTGKRRETPRIQTFRNSLPPMQPKHRKTKPAVDA